MAFGYAGDWSRGEFERTCNTSFFVEKKHAVTLDTSRSSYHNEQEIVRWAKENGWTATVQNSGDSIHVERPEGASKRPDAKGGPR